MNVSAYLMFFFSGCARILSHAYFSYLGVMLLLGEAVLSLLIVSISLESEYYFVVFIGIVTTVMIHDIYFESQPSHSNTHAMMSVTRGACYVIGIQI